MMEHWSPASHTKTEISESKAARESEIVLSAQQGSHEAFEALYKLYSRRLYNTIVSVTKSPEDAEDALQDTFLRVHRAFHTFEGRSSVYSWLTRIALNSALMTLRRRRSRPEMLFDPSPEPDADTHTFETEDGAMSPERLCDLNQRWSLIFQALGSLDEPLSEPIRMQITTGASVKEIGRTLNLTEVAVKARLHRARVRLSAVFQTMGARRKKTYPSFIPDACMKSRKREPLGVSPQKSNAIH
jgi:RNA polymerase sigma-70 factor, ECF subfamily